MMVVSGGRVFGTWPAAMVAGSRRRVVVEGPICRSSEVVGWFSKDVSSGTTNITKVSKPLKINISDFAFNSSILWDQERWGRPNSQPGVLQDSIMSVQKMITEDDVKLKGFLLVAPKSCCGTSTSQEPKLGIEAKDNK
uniref:Glycosyltransferases n=1 Tax=Ananas comosus var. bracteatus TaxID=296719 RepID=A0A6V7Q9K0_ANACO|nr:unnamed protein product [Ananas comosus var. bracteatus]